MMKTSVLSVMIVLAGMAGVSVSVAQQQAPATTPSLSIDLDSLGDTLDQLKESEDLRKDPFANQDQDETQNPEEIPDEDQALPTEAPSNEYANPNVIAVLQGLDKVTARISPVQAPVGQPTLFGTLEITTRYCRETPPTEAPETWVFLEIREVKQGEETRDLFSGWMIASSPGLSSLAHPVYDIVVKGCDRGAGPESAPAETQAE